MKLAKRIIVILLMVTLGLSMTACTSANIFGVSNPTDPLETTSANDSARTDSEPPAAYRNDYFKFSCVLPDDWYVFNRNQMNHKLGITNNALGESEESDFLRESFGSDVICLDFDAVSANGYYSIGVVLKKVRPLAIIASEQRAIDASTPLLVAHLEKMGVLDIKHSTEQVDFLGKKHVALNIQADYAGTLVYQTVIKIRKGFYISNISVSCTEQNAVQECLQYFQAID